MVRGVHKKVLERVKNFASDFGANVEIFHVRNYMIQLQKQPQKQARLMDKMLHEVPHSYKNVESTEILSAIREEIISSNTDILIMVPYRHGFWHSLLHRSKTKIMASGNSVPLLSIPL